MSMWYVGTPAMILFIIIYAFIGYDTIAANYAGSYGTVLVDGIEVIASNLIYPDWTNVIGEYLTVTPDFLTPWLVLPVENREKVNNFTLDL